MEVGRTLYFSRNLGNRNIGGALQVCSVLLVLSFLLLLHRPGLKAGHPVRIGAWGFQWHSLKLEHSSGAGMG